MSARVLTECDKCSTRQPQADWMVGKGDRQLFQSQEIMPATGRGRVPLGEIKVVGIFILIVNVPITSLAGNGADGPKQMRGRIEFLEFML